MSGRNGDEVLGADVVSENNSAERCSVTVAVSLYNYRDYVLPCLESVKSQTISAIDLVVVDDCSSDDGLDVVRKWLDATGKRFARFVFLRHKANRGLAAARNTAFSFARSEYVFVLDADNVLYPKCLQRLATSLDHSQASFAYCFLEKFGAETGLHNVGVWNPARLQLGNTIDAMVLLRRSVWRAVGGYSIRMPHPGWEDFDLWFKIARIRGWGVQVPEILGRYRVHENSMLRRVTNPNVDNLWQYLRSEYREFFSGQSHAGS